jgi:hypothetical protein
MENVAEVMALAFQFLHVGGGRAAVVAPEDIDNVGARRARWKAGARQCEGIQSTSGSQRHQAKLDMFQE